MSAPLYPGNNLGAAHPVAHAQAEIKVFGFWVFLMSDLITFGMFFATYLVMSSATDGGPGPRDLFNLQSAAIQTALLLLSSFAMGMAMLALKYRDSAGKLLGWLALTGLLAVGFLTFELRDFAAMAAKNGTPTRSGFLSAYYGLVGLHGFHVSVGLVWLALMMARLAKAPEADSTKTRMLRLSLYWHFLDLVWIGIFSIVFLGGML